MILTLSELPGGTDMGRENMHLPRTHSLLFPLWTETGN